MQYVFVFSRLIDNEKMSQISVLRNDLRTYEYIRLSTSWIKLWMCVFASRKNATNPSLKDHEISGDARAELKTGISPQPSILGG